MKKFISMLFTFILILLVLLTTILLISKSTILNESYILKQIEEEAYYDKVAENLRESFKSNILQSGLEEEFVEELIDDWLIQFSYVTSYAFAPPKSYLLSDAIQFDTTNPFEYVAL